MLQPDAEVMDDFAGLDAPRMALMILPHTLAFSEIRRGASRSRVWYKGWRAVSRRWWEYFVSLSILKPLSKHLPSSRVSRFVVACVGLAPQQKPTEALQLPPYKHHDAEITLGGANSSLLFAAMDLWFGFRSYGRL